MINIIRGRDNLKLQNFNNRENIYDAYRHIKMRCDVSALTFP